MTDRHNLCINPYCKNNVTGWGGDGSTPTRTDVSGEGFSRQWGARYTDGSFHRTATGAVTGSTDYILSIYRYIGGAAGSGGNSIYIEWGLSGGGTSYTGPVGPTWTALTVERFDISGTSPSNAVTACMILDRPSGRTVDLSMLLIEQGTSLDTYFDGDSTNGSWDGADGNSASTLTSSFPQTVTIGSGIASAEAFGTAVVTPGAVTISLTGIASEEAFGTTRVSDGSVGPGGGGEVQGQLNRLAGTYGLGEQEAANIYAGTDGLAVVGALNAKAGIVSPLAFLDLQGVANLLAGTTGLGTAEALSLIP